MVNLQINSLTNSWHDKDDIILHACFQCLVDFIEQEKPTADEFDKDVWSEIVDLYQWWTVERGKRELEDIPDSELYYDHKKGIVITDIGREIGNRNNQLEQSWYLEDSGNLIRLIMVRDYLWT